MAEASVSDIFRRAQVARREHPDWTNKQLKEFLVKEFSGGPLPSLNTLTIPEQDDKAPEEDWTAGLPVIRRGIQFNDWKEIANGVVLSLEQTENYAAARGPEGDRDDWHNRNVGISDATAKGVGKWMPAELMEIAERNTKK